MSNLTFRITGGTNVGLVRSNNEDNFIINADLSKSDWFIPSDTNLAIELGEAGCLFVVADGMGGMNAGEVASAIAIDTIKEMFSRDDFSSIIGSDNDIELFMKEVIEVADENIKVKVLEDKSTAGMGTTVVMAWVIGQKVHVAWCGDSRAYLFNTKSGLVPLSRDHSYVQQLVDDGKLAPELAFDHPDSNIITRSLGDSATKAMPDYMSRKLLEGDVILLCSDGLCGLCRDEEIVEVLAGEYDSIEQLKTHLIDRALEAGGYDNVTVALFQTVTAETVIASDMQQTSTDVGHLDEMPERKKGRSRKVLSFAAMIAVVVALFYGPKSIFKKDENGSKINSTEVTAEGKNPTKESESIIDLESSENQNNDKTPVADDKSDNEVKVEKAVQKSEEKTVVNEKTVEQYAEGNKSNQSPNNKLIEDTDSTVDSKQQAPDSNKRDNPSADSDKKEKNKERETKK